MCHTLAEKALDRPGFCQTARWKGQKTFMKLDEDKVVEMFFFQMQIKHARTETTMLSTG